MKARTIIILFVFLILAAAVVDALTTTIRIGGIKKEITIPTTTIPTFQQSPLYDQYLNQLSTLQKKNNELQYKIDKTTLDLESMRIELCRVNKNYKFCTTAVTP